jgi:hypothetical protein
MRKFFLVVLMISNVNLVYAANLVVMQISVSNFTNNPGFVFLGTQKTQVIGPAIGINGDTVMWTPAVKNNQGFGLIVGSNNFQPCFVNGGFLELSPSLYRGDAITIILGQEQFPTGIACGCFGSACTVS